MLTAGELRLAQRIAIREVRAAIPSADGSPVPYEQTAPITDSWPSNIDRVSAVALPFRDAAALLEQGATNPYSDVDPVIVLQIVGTLSVTADQPLPGGRMQTYLTARVITVIIDQPHHDGFASEISPHLKYAPRLPGAQQIQPGPR